MSCKSILSRKKISNQMDLLILSLIMSLGFGLVATANTETIIPSKDRNSKPKIITVSQESDLAQKDPLNSPHPVPWEWVINSHSQLTTQEGDKLRYYRSPVLISPDGKYAAYSRIKLELDSQLFRSRANSTIFIENLETGELEKIESHSVGDRTQQGSQREGKIAILMPVSWSETSDRLLARLFAGYFSTTDASDWGVIWDKNTNNIVSLSPDEDSYTHAILLGWSHKNPDRVLFRAGILGQEIWPVWSVHINGETILANEDRAVVYGREPNWVEKTKFTSEL